MRARQAKKMRFSGLRYREDQKERLEMARQKSQGQRQRRAFRRSMRQEFPGLARRRAWSR